MRLHATVAGLVVALVLALLIEGWTDNPVAAIAAMVLFFAAISVYYLRWN